MIKVTSGGAALLFGLYGLSVMQATEAAAEGEEERDLPHAPIGGITVLTSATTSTDVISIGGPAVTYVVAQDQITGDQVGEMPAAYEIAYPLVRRLKGES